MIECTLTHCKDKTKDHCERCGFNAAEAKRRTALPMRRGKDGLKRIYVGVSAQKAEHSVEES